MQSRSSHPAPSEGSGGRNGSNDHEDRAEARPDPSRRSRFTLLLIDAQNDYLAAAGLSPGRTSLIREMSRLLEVCRSGQAEIIHVWTTVRRDRDERMPHWKASGKWICVQGSPGHEPPDDLKPSDGERVVHKTGFSAFAGTELAETLGSECQLIVAGIHLHG